MIDELDLEILTSIRKNRPSNISDAIKPFLGQKSDRALRERIKNLYYLGYLDLDKRPSYVAIKARREPGTNLRRGESQHG